MDNTLLIQLTNNKAIKLIRELEELHLIKVLKENIMPAKIKLSDKYRGSISKTAGKNLSDHIMQMRNGWDNISLMY